MLETVLNAIYFFIPAYVANTAAGLFGHGRPVDLGKNFIDGRRILGDGVTVRGSASGIFCGTVVGILQKKFLLGFLLSFGAILGDAIGSFIKRRLHMPQGAPAPLLDQLNFVVGGLFLASFVEPISLEWVATLLIFTPFGHLLVNKIGYQLRLKNVPR